jgi:hypothetical protein
MLNGDACYSSSIRRKKSTTKQKARAQKKKNLQRSYNRAYWEAEYGKGSLAWEEGAEGSQGRLDVWVIQTNCCTTALPLYEMPWIHNSASSVQKFSVFDSSWSRTFSCITLFESGSLEVPPETLDRVMALSVGDSLYIATPLLCDPSEEPNPYEICRIRGNVGTPGIAMLIPPADPQLQQYDSASWKLVNHAPWDGRLEDSFASTSLHLSFTGYTLPIEAGGQGFRDSGIYFLETRVTVHDHGEEIGDLDILRRLSSPMFGRVAKCEHTAMSEECNRGSNSAVIDNPNNFTAVDNWAELLDGPDGAAVTRSSGNWPGRLALTVVSLQAGYQANVGPNRFCWECIKGFWVA